MIASPETVGMSSERLARIGPAIAPFIGDDGIAGAVTLVARRGQIVHLQTVGLLDRETREPMRDDAVFRIYSMTKPITCVALMMLYEQGRFQLTDPVSRWIPAFADVQVYAGGTRADMKLQPLSRPITIRDLLTHTAGLIYGFRGSGPVEEMCFEAGIAVTSKRVPLAEFVKTMTQLPLAHQPGTVWHYGVAHDVVAHLVELMSGKAFDVYVGEKILQPLGMTDTGFYVPTEKQDRFATYYGMDPKTRLPNLRVAGPRDSLESAAHNVLRGGVGLVSTIQDYQRFCQMLLNNGELDGARLLGRKTLELMLANHLAAQLLPFKVGGQYVHGYGYGLGLPVLMDVGQSGEPGSVGSYFWGGAAGTFFCNDPREQLTVIQMIQTPSHALAMWLPLRSAAYQAIVD